MLSQVDKKKLAIRVLSLVILAKRYSHISRYVCRVFWEEISIWLRGQRKAHCSPQGGWTLSNPLRAWIVQKCRGRKNSLFLPDCVNWDLSLLLLWDWDLYHRHSWFSVLKTGTGIYSTRFPVSLACRQQILRLLSLHNLMNQFLIINLIIYIWVLYKKYIQIFIYLKYINMKSIG